MKKNQIVILLSICLVNTLLSGFIVFNQFISPKGISYNISAASEKSEDCKLAEGMVEKYHEELRLNPNDEDAYRALTNWSDLAALYCPTYPDLQ